MVKTLGLDRKKQDRIKEEHMVAMQKGRRAMNAEELFLA